MAWAEFADEQPDLADRVRRRFGIGTNKTLATLRRDGSPRISASEVEFDGAQVTLGMMGGSMKLLDVRRDPRVALHCPTIETPEADQPGWPGDAKLAGLLVEVPEPEGNTHAGAGFFRVDVKEVVLTYVAAERDHLVVEAWHEGRGVTRSDRY